MTDIPPFVSLGTDSGITTVPLNNLLIIIQENEKGPLKAFIADPHSTPPRTCQLNVTDSFTALCNHLVILGSKFVVGFVSADKQPTNIIINFERVSQMTENGKTTHFTFNAPDTEERGMPLKLHIHSNGGPSGTNSLTDALVANNLTRKITEFPTCP